MPLDKIKKAEREKKHRQTKKGKATQKKAGLKFKNENIKNIPLNKDIYSEVKASKDQTALTWNQYIKKINDQAQL